MIVPMDVPQLPLEGDFARCGWRPVDRRRVIDPEKGMTFELMCARPPLHPLGHRLEWVEVGPRIAQVETGGFL